MIIFHKIMILLFITLNFQLAIADDSTSVKINLDNSLDPNFSKLPDCISNHPITNICQFAMCKIDAMYGTIYVKTKVLDNGDCQYIERMRTLGGIDCVFKTSQLPKIHKLLARYFDRMSYLKRILGDVDATALGDIFSNCTVSDAYTNTNTIEITASKANYFDPNFKPSDIIKYYNSYLTKQNVNYKATLSNYRSIFFDPKN